MSLLWSFISFWQIHLVDGILLEYKLESLNKRIYFPTVLEAGKSKIKGPADSIPGEGSLLGL